MTSPLVATAMHTSASTLNEGSLGVTSAGGMICIGFGILSLILAVWSVVESTPDANRRQHYQRLLATASTSILLLFCVVASAWLGLWPRWTIGVAFAGWFSVGVPMLVWFNSRMRALAM